MGSLTPHPHFGAIASPKIYGGFTPKGFDLNRTQNTILGILGVRIPHVCYVW